MIQLGLESPEERSGLNHLSAVLKERIFPMTDVTNVNTNQFPAGELRDILDGYISRAQLLTAQSFTF